ncbi:MAG: hypothetical protein E7309_16450 [Butyrivibrio sp.]|jgi:hypothetical protein|nr:hypothetical protein [Butyrivibrio sp.]
MSKNIRQVMHEAAPELDVAKKDVFIRRYRKMSGRSELGVDELLKSQMSYIRMPVWIVSIAALIVAIFGIGLNRETVFYVAAIMPFVSAIAVFDSMRSRLYGMDELEGATRISGRGILFARLICIGTVHLALLLALSVVVGTSSGYGFAMTGAIITIPYLISSIACMILERTEIGRRNAFGCVLVSAVTAFMILAIKDEKVFFAQNYRWIWFVLFVFLAALECIEIRKTFHLEEYEWN